MGKRKKPVTGYLVKVMNDPGLSGQLWFTYFPESLQRSLGGHEPPVNERYILAAGVQTDATTLVWKHPPPDAATRDELEAVARDRLAARRAWLDRLRSLLATVEPWARDLGFSTRVVDKRMEDPEVGDYTAPALLMQETAHRFLLEPVARSTPGTEGVVDLYLMPAYDDIATFAWVNGQWGVYYVYQADLSVVDPLETEPWPLSKATLRKVLDQMKIHAG